MNQIKRGRGLLSGFLFAATRFGIAAANGSLSQSLDVIEEVFAGLFAENFAEQHAERTHVAAQRRLFEVARLRLQFS